MEFVQHPPLIENGCRRVAVRFEQPDGSGVEDFVDLPLDDLVGKSDDEVVSMILTGRDKLAAKHAAQAERVEAARAKAAPEPDDAVSRALKKLAKK